ncbi:MAG: Multidrug export protein MepA [Pseudomonadota bacterium]|jgi:putative MATE family efflux protein
MSVATTQPSPASGTAGPANPADASTPRAATASPGFQRILNAPILPTLLSLSAPNVLSMVMFVLVGIAETYYIGRLGTTPLAAMALVFPFAMLTGMMSAGAMGGGVSSAVSRALGASDPGRANTLAMHATAIATVAGIVYTAVFLLFGPALYRLLGGKGAVLDAAVGYSNVLFLGALLVWLSNTLAAVLRGTGDMRVPMIGLVATSVLQILLGGVLGLGAGPVPSLGMAGVAIGHIVATGIGVVFFLWYLMSGQGRLTMRLRGVAMQRELFADILRVGAVACLSPVQSVVTVLIFTGFVARLGVLPLAGYSIGQRLEFLLIPIAFGVGVASVPMIGMAIGAGNVERARRVAWIAAGVSAVALAVISVVVVLAPDLWAGLFTADEAVLEYARLFLRITGPAYPLFGVGLTLYFSSQGAGKVLGPVLAGTARLAIVAGVGVFVAGPDATARDCFLLVAAAMSGYGLLTMLAVKVTPWGPHRASGSEAGAREPERVASAGSPR